MSKFLLALSLTLLAACSAVAPREQPGDDELRTTCAEPRPQVCTLEYAPVCAFLGEQGVRREFASGCSACSDPAVRSYIPEPCPDR